MRYLDKKFNVGPRGGQEDKLYEKGWDRIFGKKKEVPEPTPEPEKEHLIIRFINNLIVKIFLDEKAKI